MRTREVMFLGCGPVISTSHAGVTHRGAMVHAGVIGTVVQLSTTPGVDTILMEHPFPGGPLTTRVKGGSLMILPLEDMSEAAQEDMLFACTCDD